MIKPSARRSILIGSLFILAGIALFIVGLLGPAKLSSGWLRHHLWSIYVPAACAGVAVVARAVWQLVLGAPWAPGTRSRAFQWVRAHQRALLGGITATSVVAFAVLTAISRRLPDPRGTHFVTRDQVVRLSALGSGLILLLCVLSVSLPLILNRLETAGFCSFVGARHVRASKSGFLTVISILSIAGVGVSSCSLVSVVSIMGGFGEDLKRKILGNNAHITIDVQSKNGFGEWTSVLDQVRLAKGVAAATPVVSGEAMASSVANTSGVMVRGVDPESIGTVIDLIKNIEVGKFGYLTNPEQLTRLGADEVIGLGPGGEPFMKGSDFGLGSYFGATDPGAIDPDVKEALRGPPVRPGLVIGRELAKTLHVYVGDEVTLVSPLGDLGPMGVMPRSRRFRVASIFYSGMYEYDASHVYVKLDVAQELFGVGSNVTAVEIRALDGETASEVRPGVAAAIGRKDLRVRDWRELNKNLFSALKLERIATFLILSLATAVASFCIICTLLLMVTEKGKEIAILKALGSSSAAIRRIFMLEGIIIGLIGTVFGVATGVMLCRGLKWYGLRLDPDVYYIDRLPIAINYLDYAIVALSAMVICTIATLYPAHAASKLNPVQGLRYE